MENSNVKFSAGYKEKLAQAVASLLLSNKDSEIMQTEFGEFIISFDKNFDGNLFLSVPTEEIGIKKDGVHIVYVFYKK